MTDQITVPRETWDATRGALEECRQWHQGDKWRDSPKFRSVWEAHRDTIDAALTAAASVSHPKTETAPPAEGGAITSESAANAVSTFGTLINEGTMPQAQGDLNRPEIASYVARFGGNCRDCADENGICPNSGMPCDSRKAIEHVLKALNYGFKHGYIAHPQATEPAPKNLIGWRTADYLRETTDRHTARNWEVHYEVLPIFEGDANTKLAAAPEAKQ